MSLGAQTSSLLGVLFFMPFIMFSHGITHILIRLASRPKTLGVLLFTQLAYATWYGFWYIDIFYVHIDPQSPIALLFIGLVSLPAMAILWIGAAIAGRLPRGQLVSTANT